jgi:hypothetical protein
VWIVSRLNAFGFVFLTGLFAGFALGVHAIQSSPGAFVGCAALGALLGAVAARRFDRSAPQPSPPSPTPTRAPLHSPSPATDDAEAALVTLGYGAREARTAVASALATLDDDADASAIVRAVLRARNR